MEIGLEVPGLQSAVQVLEGITGEHCRHLCLSERSIVAEAAKVPTGEWVKRM